MGKSSKIRNLYDLKDICRLLGASYNTVIKLIHTGEIKHTRIAQKYYVSRRNLNQFMNTGNIFDKPDKVILDTIKQAIGEAMNENMERLELAVKQKIVTELESNIKKNLIKINKKNQDLKEVLPKEAVKNLRYRETKIRKDFEKVK